MKWAYKQQQKWPVHSFSIVITHTKKIESRNDKLIGLNSAVLFLPADAFM